MGVREGHSDAYSINDAVWDYVRRYSVPIGDNESSHHLRRANRAISWLVSKGYLSIENNGGFIHYYDTGKYDHDEEMRKEQKSIKNLLGFVQHLSRQIGIIEMGLQKKKER